MFSWFKWKPKENIEFEKHRNILNTELDKPLKNFEATVSMLNRISLLGKLASNTKEMTQANELSTRVRTKLKYQGIIK